LVRSSVKKEMVSEDVAFGLRIEREERDKEKR